MLNKIPEYVWIILVLLLGLVFLGVLVFSTRDAPTKQDQQLIDIAAKLGLDKDKFANDFRSEEIKNIVQSQLEQGLSKFEGLNRYTPLVILNGEVIKLSQIEEIEKLLKDKLGNSEGKVNLEIYSDFSCPFCKLLFEFMLDFQSREPELFDSRINYQKLNLPIIGGNTSQKYAYAYEAAKMQGKGDEYARELYGLMNKK